LGEPYINNCGFDTAGRSLSWMIGGVNPRNLTISNILTSFDQSYYTVVSPIAISMANTGYLYIPRACQQGTRCRLLVFFHGCLMSQTDDPYSYIRHTGYNFYAETNNIVILFPQAAKTVVNPNGCWDWWGFTSTAYATKLGPQIAAVKNMIDAL